METLTFTRCRNLDVNGNPRYVVHFLNLNTRAERDALCKRFPSLSEDVAELALTEPYADSFCN